MPFLIDSMAVSASSYPSHAIEANPANSLEMPYRQRGSPCRRRGRFANPSIQGIFDPATGLLNSKAAPRLIILIDLGLVAQHRVQQRGVNLYFSVVVDERR
jgi:hypothetical protein